MNNSICPACEAPAQTGANYCSRCGSPLNGAVVSREEITVGDGDSGVEDLSGLKISVDEIYTDSVSYAMRLPRHPKLVVKDQSVNDVAQYAVAPDGLVEVKVLDINYDDSDATFLVTLKQGRHSPALRE